MELSVARSRAVSAPEPASRVEAVGEPASSSEVAAAASFPPLARTSMVTQPWECHPLRAGLRSLFGRRGPIAPAARKPWQKVAHYRRTVLTWATLLPAAVAT